MKKWKKNKCAHPLCDSFSIALIGVLQARGISDKKKE
jgi:hypothetical protein